MLGMSVWFHSKMSNFFFKSFVSSALTHGTKLALIRIVFSESSSQSAILTNGVVGSPIGCDLTCRGSRLVMCISSNSVDSEAYASAMSPIRFFFGLRCFTVLLLMMGVVM